MSLVAEFSDSVKPHLLANKWVIAFSGGLDSTVLLNLAADYCNYNKTPPLHVLHINHGLSDYAEQWQQHCANVSKQLNLPFSCIRVDVDKQAGDIENAARNARYQAFDLFLSDGDLLMLGHHLQDHAETILYRLFRGTGVKGLTGIPKQRVINQATLLRPVLNCSQQQLASYAKKNTLAYIEDDSNNNVRFDRNYIRHHLMSPITDRWPSADKAIHKASKHMVSAQCLLDDLAQIDVKNYIDSRGGLSLQAFENISSQRIRNVIRYWLEAYDLNPSEAQYQQIQTQFLESKTDANPSMVLQSFTLRRFHKYLYCEPNNTLELPLPELIALDIDKPLILNDNVSVSFEPVKGAGLLITNTVKLTFLAKLTGGQSLRFKPVPRAHSNTIKKLMQENNVMPWHRKTLPVLLQGDTIIAIAGLGVATEFKADKNQLGYRMKLHIGAHIYLCE